MNHRVTTTPSALRRSLLSSLLRHILLLGGALVMLYPLLWMLSSSFKPQRIIFSDLSLWPSQFTLENYVRGWNAIGVPFSHFFVNSMIISSCAVLGTVLSCSLAAFAFARLEFKLKKLWFAVMLLTIMLPFHVTLIPRYVLFLNLQWINTFLPLIVPHFLAVDSFFVFLIVQFIRGLPRDFDDAAAIDGASELQTYWHIILPLSAPALATTAIFSFIWTWDNFFSQLLYLSRVSLYTVPLGLRFFVDSTDRSSYGPLFAMSILALIPIFTIFVCAQRQLVEGVSMTGIKG
ncbi:MAG: carbohydrate ABC transporter permease [Anaerolineae bacterium]